MANDLTAYNNEIFQVTFNVSAWKTAYDLLGSAWRLQARTTASSQIAILDIPNASGSADYTDIDDLTGVIVFSLPRLNVQALEGAYAYDYGFTPVGGDFIRIDGGTLTFNQGVTR